MFPERFSVDNASLGRCVPWTMCPLDDVSLGRCVPWTMCPLDDVSLGRCVPWTMCPLDDLFLGRCVPWTMRHLDEASSYDPSLIGRGGGGAGRGLTMFSVYWTYSTSFKPLVTDLLDFGKIGFNSNFYYCISRTIDSTNFWLTYFKSMPWIRFVCSLWHQRIAIS